MSCRSVRAREAPEEAYTQVRYATLQTSQLRKLALGYTRLQVYSRPIGVARVGQRVELRASVGRACDSVTVVTD